MAKKYGERWIVLKSLREGGQAHTFIVADSRGSGDEQYVLKRLKNPNRVSRFKNEIEAIRNLSHDNILRLIDFDLEADKPYLVTEFCKGGSLAETKRFWQNSPVQALRLFQDICAGVSYAHNQGIIHSRTGEHARFLEIAPPICTAQSWLPVPKPAPYYIRSPL